MLLIQILDGQVRISRDLAITVVQKGSPGAAWLKRQAGLLLDPASPLLKPGEYYEGPLARAHYLATQDPRMSVLEYEVADFIPRGLFEF